jgi:hypothetical protein
MIATTHNPFDESRSGALLEGKLHEQCLWGGAGNGPGSSSVPRQSLTRQPLFHNLKRWWGANNLWQQSKPALELWMQIRSTAYTLTQMLALTLFDSFPTSQLAPWREGATVTAGLFATWLRYQFTGLRLRSAYRPTSRKFNMPEPAPHPLL